MEIVRFHQHNSWITCALEFRGRWNEQWQPHRFTWLYFYDEAVSFAAGHRPCAECRWRNYKAYQAAWAAASGGAAPTARETDRQLHGERLVRGTHRRRLWPEEAGSLPDGAFILMEGDPFVVVADEVVRWTRGGYRERRRRPTGIVTAITPPSTLAVLRAGYAAQVHESTRRPAVPPE